MTTEQFAYWLKGFMEIQNPDTLDKDQLQIIKDHLDLVFNKVTPVRTPVSAPSGSKPWTPTPIPSTPSTYPGLFPKTYPDPIVNPSPSNPWDQGPTIYCSTGDTTTPLCSIEDFSSMLKGPAVEPASEDYKKGPSKRFRIVGEIGERIPNIGRGCRSDLGKRID